MIPSTPGPGQTPNHTQPGPLATINIAGWPNANAFSKAVKTNRFKGADYNDEWRSVGKFAALSWMNGENAGEGLPAGEKFRVEFNIFFPDNIRRDVHNTYFKPVIDGFTDAGLWKDDNFSIIPELAVRYAGINPDPRTGTLIKIEIFGI